MSEHTKGLLALFRDGQSVGAADGTGVCEVWPRDESCFPNTEGKANARRIVACWNLLDGYDTKAFEGMTLAEFVAKQAYLSEMTTHDGLSITLSGLAMQMVAASFAGQFKANGASNYLEISASHPDTGPFTITMQRKEGVTPIMKLEAMTKQLDALHVTLKAANQRITMMAKLMRETLDVVPAIGVQISDLPVIDDFLERIDAALSCELPDHIAGAEKMVELNAYDAGYLNDFGGGNVGWWHDYIRSELDRAHDFYQSQLVDGNHVEQTLAMVPEGWQLVPVEPTPEMVEAYFAGKMEAQSCTHQQRARERVARDYKAMLAAAPKQQGGAPCDTGLPSSKSD